MSRTSRWLMIAVVGLLLACPAMAATYYAAPEAAGSGDGETEANAKALGTASWVSAGDTVYLVNGEYGSWSTPKAGSAGSVIHLVAVNQYGPKFTWVGVSHSYWTISGIDVNHPPDDPPWYGETAMRIHGSSYEAMITNITVTGCKIHGPSVGTGPATEDLQVRYASTVLIEDCEVYYGGPRDSESGSSAIQIDDSAYVTIRGCDVHSFLSGGIRTGSGANYTFEYNRVYDQRYDLLPAVHGSGIAIHTPSTTIRGNIVYDCGNTNAIRFYQEVEGVEGDGYHDMLVENNVVYLTGTGLSYWSPNFIDLGEDCVFRNNTFVGGVAMHLAENADGSGLYIENNIFGYLQLDNFGATSSQTTEEALVNWPNVHEGGNVYKDLIAMGGPTQYQIHLTEFSATSTSLYLPDSEDWAVGAMFASSTGDYPYQLAAGSPAIELADPANAPSIDLLERARSVAAPDAGAYEYQDGGNPPAGTTYFLIGKN